MPKKMNTFCGCDACPVKNEILHIAATYEIDVTFVASYSHAMTKLIGGNWIYVDANKEEVDMYITH